MHKECGVPCPAEVGTYGIVVNPPPLSLTRRSTLHPDAVNQFLLLLFLYISYASTIKKVRQMLTVEFVPHFCVVIIVSRSLSCTLVFS